jgi:hypothetical protein
MVQTNLWHPPTAHLASRRHSATSTIRSHTHTINYWHTLMICPCHLLHHVSRTGHHRLKSIKGHTRHRSSSYSTAQLCAPPPTPPSDTLSATCTSTSTVTPLIYRKPNPGATPGALSSSAQNLTIRQLYPAPPPHLHHTTAPSTPSATLCEMSWHLPQKQSSALSSKMLATVSLSASLFKKWDTRKLPHPSKPTMHAQLASPMKRLNSVAQKPSTCAFTGSATESSKANSQFIGVQVKTTSPTTLPSTIPQPIIN